MLGILGLVFCALLAPVAWYKGETYRKACIILDQQPDTLAVIGRLLGKIVTIIFGITFVLWLIAMLGLIAFGREVP